MTMSGKDSKQSKKFYFRTDDQGDQGFSVNRNGLLCAKKGRTEKNLWRQGAQRRAGTRKTRP